MQLDPMLTEKLYEDFPRLYRGHKKTPQESSMCWGFECGDGWYQLLHDLSAQLTAYMAEHPELDLVATQVKSKFGSLRFHLNEDDAATRQMIEAAQARALVTCEITGQPGQICVGKTRRELPMVLCPEKAEELGYSVWHPK